MVRLSTTDFPGRSTRLVAGLMRALLIGLALCATAAQAQQQADPWEGYNRWMYNANDGLDRYIVRPVAKGYDAIMPEAGRKGVNNFFKNFYDFNAVLNAALQGRFEEAVREVTNAIRATGEAGEAGDVEGMKRRLELYRAGKPFRLGHD